MLKYTLVFLLAATGCLSLTPCVMRLAVGLGAIDYPDARRVHSSPTPRFGGLAVFLSIVFGLGTSLLLDPSLRQYGGEATVLALAAASIMLLGLADDCRSIRPGFKVMIEAGVALAVFLAGYQITDVFGWHLGWVAAPATMLWIIALTNAFNLIDGLDGLATGVGAIISATLFALSLYDSHAPSALVLAAVCGALFGFLRYNFFPAKIFLGDSGSLLLGFIFAVVSIRVTHKSSAALAISIPILALGLPLAEMILTIIRRTLQVVHVRRGGSDGERYQFLFLRRATVFTADKAHIHHRLLDSGITHRNTVLLLYGVCSMLCTGALALIFYRGAEEGLILGVFAVAAIIGVRRLGYEEFQLLRNGLLLPLVDAPIFSLRPFQALLDIASIAAAYLFSFLIWSQASSTTQLTPMVLHGLPVVCFAQIASFAVCNPYSRSHRLAGIGGLLAILRTLLIAEFVSWTVYLLVYGWQGYNLVVIIIDSYLLATMIISWRFSFLVLEHYFQVKESAHKFVGNGSSANAPSPNGSGSKSPDRVVNQSVATTSDRL